MSKIKCTRLLVALLFLQCFYSYVGFCVANADKKISTLSVGSNSEDPIIRERADKELTTTLTPKDAADLAVVDRELDSSDPNKRARALGWLQNTSDKGLAPEINKIFRTRANRLSANQQAPETPKEKAANEEVLGAVMLKLGDLQYSPAIPELRRYAKDKNSEILVAAALTALATLNDEASFGSDKKDQLRHRFVKTNDPATKAWLKHTVLNDSDRDIRYLAADAYAAKIADPADQADVAFAHQLLKSSDANLRTSGARVLASRLLAGFADSQVISDAISLLGTGPGKDASAAVLILSAVRKGSPFATRTEKALLQYLSTPTPPRKDAKAQAQFVMSTLTGHYPHFDGEAYCDQHPKVFPNGMRLPR